MNNLYLILLSLFISTLISCNKEPVETIEKLPISVEKTNSTKVYVHYMPWFETKEFSGKWGFHWTMNNQNPDLFDGEGNRKIASHYYPLIGTYDSEDPDLVEYHLLLMKYSGIDGVLIDWYGSFNVADYGLNLKNSNSLIFETPKYALDFGIVYEEFTTEKSSIRFQISEIEAAVKDLEYIENNYLTMDNYIFFKDRPLLLTFGPRYIRSKTKWSTIFESVETEFSFLPLWNFTNLVGSENSVGEYAWIDFSSDSSLLKSFYSNNMKENIIGSVFPGFHDFYKEGGVGESYGYLSHANGTRLDTNLELINTYNLSHVQLVTWNDFGEGTILEPTAEFEYKYLEKIQKFTGVKYGVDDLKLITKLYGLRKLHKTNNSIQEQLDIISEHLRSLETDLARKKINSIN
ncbi:MAG: hypothetical protein HWE24_13420 [Oceanospirillaceae bacterium]|nr:hypothetical protein [Oceanospirillaceae bacterium]